MKPGESPTSESSSHTSVIGFQPGAYRDVHDLQQELVAARGRLERPDTILIGEHERVITLGRTTQVKPLQAPMPIVEIERGGEATWHGPGQLVGYPIVHLRELGLGIREYLRRLERALIVALGDFGVEAEVIDGATGVWVGDRKVASIGVAVRRQVAWHGFALNVSADLADFHWIEPCGFAPQVMANLSELCDAAVELSDVRDRVLAALVGELGLAPLRWES